MDNKIIYPVDNPSPKAFLARGNSYRLAAGVITLACLGILALAAWLTPNPEGVGTHKQLGLDVCGFYERTGYPCPTCGMTTAFAHVLRGQLLDAFAVQPAGALAALLCAAAALTGAYVTFTGKHLDQYFPPVNALRLLIAVAVIVLAAWGWLCALTYLRCL